MNSKVNILDCRGLLLASIIISACGFPVDRTLLHASDWVGGSGVEWFQSGNWSDATVPGAAPATKSVGMIRATKSDVVVEINQVLPAELETLRIDSQATDGMPHRATLRVKEQAKLSTRFLTLNENNGSTDDTSGHVLVDQQGGMVTVRGPIRFARDPIVARYHLAGGVLKHMGQGGGEAIEMRPDRPSAIAELYITGGVFVSGNRIRMGASDSRIRITGGSFILDGVLDMGTSTRTGDRSLLEVVGRKIGRVIVTTLVARRHPDNRRGSAIIRLVLDEEGIRPVIVTRLSGPAKGDKLVVDVTDYRGTADTVTLIDYEEFDGMRWAPDDIEIVGGTGTIGYAGGDGTAIIVSSIQNQHDRR